MNPPDQVMQDCELNKQLKRARFGLCQASGAMQLAVLWGSRQLFASSARQNGPENRAVGNVIWQWGRLFVSAGRCCGGGCLCLDLRDFLDQEIAEYGNAF